MHLHTLTLQALGPFPGRHTIDFAELGASGLFLLEGPTGAGKSTIIDAIVFALYGKVASRDATEERLRSAHAAPGDETVVDLVLETGAGVFRVRRTPAYRRPKQRGTGTTLQQATVKLWRLSDPDRPDDGELLSTRLDEAGLELQRVVGLDRAQLVQTVVLPQGEFAAFLRAEPEDRRGLLQKVFGTEVYERVQQRLERMRAEVGRTLDDAREAVVRAADHLVGAAALDDDAAAVVRAAAQAPDAVDAVTPPAREELARLVARARSTARTATTAKARCAATQRALDDARALVAADRRRTTLRAELAALLDGAEAHALGTARLAEARRALVVLPAVTAAEQAAAVARAADDRLAGARGSAPEDVLGLVDPTDSPELQRKVLLVERDTWTGLRGTLQRAARLEDDLADRRADLTAAERTRTTHVDAVRALEGERAALPARRAALEADLAALGGVDAEHEAARTRLAAVEERCGAARDAVTIAAQLATAEDAVVRAADRARATVDRVATLQRARIAGMAGELAAALAPGEPCVVCGGTEHPAPAALSPDHVTEDVLTAAERDRSAAVDVLTAATASATALRERLAARTEAAAGTLDDVLAERAVAAEDVTRAAAAVAERDRQQRALTALEREGEALGERLARAHREAARSEARVTDLRDRLTLDEVEVAGARDGADSVRTRLRAVEHRIAALGDLADALAEAEDARSRSAERFDDLAAALAEHDFDDVAAVRAAALGAADLRTLERLVADYEADLHRVRSGLADPELVTLPDVLDVDLAVLQEAHDVADAEAGRLQGEAARAEHLATAAAAAVTVLEQAVGRLRAVQAEAGPVVRMADLAAASGSDNAKRLTLATYVLVRRFEDVVAAANARLLTMSDGRYELVRSEEKEAVRSRRTGLAMKVVDHRTGVDRDPRTLSGGETFYVSLCLALGLADVVTAEAGGIDLGTLFVDEGFGSLDPETLDVVLAELSRLREGGRVVGVVSHVEALKQAIAERIEVRRRPDGSSTLAVRA